MVSLRGTGGSGLGALLIDGRSGSGKTELADSLLRALRAAGADPQALRAEDLYPGWDGLAEGSLAVARALGAGGYRRFDWAAGEFAEWVRIDPRSPLVIEGCGAITRANLAAARSWARAHAGGSVRSVWLDAPAAERKRRALARDGDAYAPHWDRWAEQEDAHYALHAPWRLADEVRVQSGGGTRSEEGRLIGC